MNARSQKRWRFIVGCGLVFALIAWFGAGQFFLVPKPILVGVLHSQTGPIAVSEQAMIEAEQLAFEEINAAGGILGRPIQWIIADGASDWPTFAREAERLISDEGVTVLFGCWTSASRKSVLPVLERSDHLLIYPMAYEGLEACPNVIYTGAAPNQQITPAVQWCQSALNARRFFLLGSDYIWPHCVNAIISDQLMGLGVEKVAEQYVPFGSTNLKAYVQEIVDTQPDAILCSVVGDSAIAFFRELRKAGISPDDIPVITFALAEDELRSTNHADMVGHYAAWNYFQSIDSEENKRFVSAFKERYGADRVTSDVIAAAYNSVYLWANAVRESGNTDVQQVRNALRQQSLNAPEGIIAVDPSTQHTWRPVYIGKIQADKQFEIVWTSNGSVRPVPYPITRSKRDWTAFVNDLQRRWGGWSNTQTNKSDEALKND
ncbi:MAG: urea ABC transporter substrate-binding protein [Pirellulales bacterium]|nr:urea ABC transporter substrate-binding protein [Pirellulales bacterium]MDA7992965.1 urea ABC transporter substrate-binding protein [Pirellulales bacterium]|tara:strand:- start:244 stop:1542 length:1299 start_codon:yes stop_codon:yes gene_type:complete